MEKIDFNNPNFKGFTKNEKILLDTGIVLALLNEYDSWHRTVKNLFKQFIIKQSNEEIPFLYVNPTILNEITFLADRPFKNYKRANSKQDFSKIKPYKVVEETVASIRTLIDKEVLFVVDGNKY